MLLQWERMQCFTDVEWVFGFKVRGRLVEILLETNIAFRARGWGSKRPQDLGIGV